MIKNLIKSTVILLILFLLPLSVLSSGKMEVKLNDKVTLQAQDVQAGSSYKWVVKKGEEIISTQTNPIFNYVFVQQGEYTVNLTITDTKNNIRNTSIMVLAGDRYSRPDKEGEEAVPETGPLMISYSTLPPVQDDGAVHLLGDGKVLFNIKTTRSDILEYRIDRNIFEDSDGNGTANDDIDNANDDSYLLGGPWETEYKLGEATKIVAEITLLTKDGEKTKSQIEIVFDEMPESEGAPVAILEVTPEPDSQSQLVYLYDDPSTVAFYARRSTGKILEYRIDRNIFEDSDRDGNPANDIDNLKDISFKTGDVWKTQYDKTDEQIIAQLIVVGESGKGSRVQRGISFSDTPKPPSIAEAAEGIRLTADKEFVLKGDPVNFSVEGLTQAYEAYIFAWDFDGDSVTDKEIEADNMVSHIYDVADLYNVKVTVTDLQGESADFKMDFLVKDIVTTIADFEYETDGNAVNFTNKSTAALNLANKNLDYTWSFGDTDPESYEEQRDQIGAEDPTYTYSRAGNYIVTLTVVDADQVTDTKTAEIIIEGDLEPVEPVTEVTPDAAQEVKKEGGSTIGKIFKIILYLLLVVIALVILIFVGFLSFLKIQHPDLTFEELIDEVKIKLLGKLGVHEIIEETKKEEAPAEEGEVMNLPEEAPITAGEPAEVPKPTATAPSDAGQAEEAEVVEPEESIVEEVKESKEPPLAKETGPVPDWMKTTAEEPTPTPAEETTTPTTADKPAPAEQSAPAPEPEAETLVETPAEEVETTVETPASPSGETPAAPEEETSADDLAAELAMGAEEDEEPEEESDKGKKPPAKGGGTPPLSDQSGPVPDWLKGA